MPAAEQAFNDSIRRYVTEGQIRGLETRTLYMRDRVPRHFRAFQKARGRPWLAPRVERADLAAYRDSLLKGAKAGSDWHARSSLCFVNQWLAFNGNAVACLRGVRWITDSETVSGRWLSPEERALVERSASDAVSAWIAHCGFRLCLRRKEWLMLTVDQINFKRRLVLVRGKGKKRRSVCFSASTEPLARAALAEREERAGAARLAPPHTVLAVRYSRGLKAPGATWADNQVAALSEASGVVFRSHDMRRTGARLLHQAGFPLPELVRFLGHSKPETTLRYIGAFEADMADAFHLAEAKQAAQLAAR